MLSRKIGLKIHTFGGFLVGPAGWLARVGGQDVIYEHGLYSVLRPRASWNPAPTSGLPHLSRVARRCKAKQGAVSP
jgi:hypothetical protein